MRPVWLVDFESFRSPVEAVKMVLMPGTLDIYVEGVVP